MILLWKACCTWKVATALMSNVLKYHISSLSEGESPHSFILFWLKHGVHYNSFLIFSPMVWGHPVSPRQSSVIAQHTDCNLLSSLQIHPIQYQCPLLLFSEDVVPYWRCCFIRDWCLFISSPFKTLHISWAAADLQTLEFLNLCVCSIYCFGIFPSPSHQTLSEAVEWAQPWAWWIACHPQSSRLHQILESLGCVG